jgi:hypothetical protein
VKEKIEKEKGKNWDCEEILGIKCKLLAKKPERVINNKFGDKWMQPDSSLDAMSYFEYFFKRTLDKAVHTLEGIIKGIAIDGKINKSEIEELSAWCNDYVGIKSRSPFNELIPLIKKAVVTGIFTKAEIADICWSAKNLTTPNLYFDIISADIQRLQGILHGILADNRIEEEELKQLGYWLAENTHLKSFYPYDEIGSIIAAVMRDGKIDAKEHDMLRLFFSEFISLPTHSTIDQNELAQLKKSITLSGVCAYCPEIKIEGRTFCFAGISSRASHGAIAKAIEAAGGTYIDNVRQDLNYLIVGDHSNPCWPFSCCGRKVEQVIDYRKKGINIVIVNENDFWDALG